MKNYEYTYFFLLYFLYFLYLALFLGFGFIYDLKEYINTLNFVLRLYVCSFLIYRFHPFQKKTEFTSFDKQIVFSSAVFLLTTIGITEIFHLFRDITDEKNYLDLVYNASPNPSYETYAKSIFCS